MAVASSGSIAAWPPRAPRSIVSFRQACVRGTA